MGGVASINFQSRNNTLSSSSQQQQQENSEKSACKGSTKSSYHTLVHLMMPKYYLNEPPSPEDLAAVNNSWNIILSNTASRYFYQRTASMEFARKYPTAFDYFATTFFTRAFDIHPTTKLTLGKVDDHQQFLGQLVSFAINRSLGESDHHRTIIEHFVEVQYRKGIRAVDYGTIGDVLMYTLREVLGLDFSPPVELAWIKVYSRFLSTIMLNAVTLEMSGAERKTISQNDFYYSLHSSGKFFNPHHGKPSFDSTATVQTSTSAIPVMTVEQQALLGL